MITSARFATTGLKYRMADITLKLIIYNPLDCHIMGQISLATLFVSAQIITLN
jgi:hypothetical protein